MSKWRKKPIVIDAFLWTGDEAQTEDPEWAVEAIKAGDIIFVNEFTENVEMHIRTFEGWITGSQGDYIIQGIQGEIYPCKPDIFKATYDKVEK